MQMTKYVRFPLVLLLGVHMMCADNGQGFINSFGGIDMQEHCVTKPSNQWTAVGFVISCCALGYNLVTNKDIHWLLKGLMVAAPLTLGTLKDQNVKLLYANANGYDLHAAAAKNDINAMSILIESGSQTLKTDIRKRTPLMYAAAAGAVQAVNTLLSVLPVSVQMPVKYVAVADRGNKPPVEFPEIKEIPCVDMVDVYGRTAAHYAALNGHGEVLLKLVHDYSASINISDNNGKTVRMLMQQNATLRKILSEMLVNK